MNSALRSTAPQPLRELRPRVWWSLDATGTFTELDGPAAERARMALGGMFRGRSYREIFEAETLARELIDRVYAGAPCAVGVVPWGGEWWEARAIGVYEDGQLVRVDGESVPVPEGTVLVGMPEEDRIAFQARETARGGMETFRLTRPVQSMGADLAPGDLWTEGAGGFSSTRFYNERMARFIRTRYAAAFEPLSPPPSGARPAPVAPSAPFLQLVE